jgi:formylglycine-generating enzyme required for sulfatase activity
MERSRHEPATLNWTPVERIHAKKTKSLRVLARTGALDPMRDLRGVRFTGADFSGWDLRRVDLSGADLRGTTLAKAKLDATTLLNGAVIDKADLEAVQAAAGRFPRPESLRAGTTICDAPWAPQMVYVPPGVFEVGISDSEREGLPQGRREDTQMVVRTQIGHGFWLGRYPVTVGEYQAFVEATGNSGSSGWSKSKFQKLNRDRHPVVEVSWDDAVAYSRWLTMETGHRYWLPTGVEWEYACRAGTRTSRYWGDEWGQGDLYAHVVGNGTRCVGELSPNAWGLHDTLGNVWEWTQDAYPWGLAGQPPDRSAVGARVLLQALRGGSWRDYTRGASAGFRLWLDARDRGVDVGFRVARGS